MVIFSLHLGGSSQSSSDSVGAIVGDAVFE